jgi:phytoene dehydrogenase-like protein
VGLDRRSILPLRKIASHETTLPDGTVVSLGDNFKVSVHRAVGKTDNARLQRELKNMRKKWEPVLRLFEDDILIHAFSLPRLLPKLLPHLLKLQGTVASEIHTLVSDDAVRAALAAPMLLFTGTTPQKMSVKLILNVVAILSEGYFLPVGGMGKIPEALGHSLKRNGGEISLNAKVRKIVLKNGRVYALEIEGEGLVEVDAVISTAGTASLVSLLNSEDLARQVQWKKQKTALLPHNVLSLQLGLSNVIDGCSYSNSILPFMEDQARYFNPKKDEVKWFAYFVPTVTIPDLAPKGGCIIEMFPGIEQGADHWDEEKTEKTGQSALRALSRLHPIDVAVKRVISPKDFQVRMPLSTGVCFSHSCTVPGLYQAGHGTYPGYGVAPAAMSGILAAEALLGMKNTS